MPLVLVETIEPGARNAATRRHSERLISRFSATASMIHSQRPTRPRSSSKLPGVISAFAASVKKADRPLLRRALDSCQRRRVPLRLIRQHDIQQVHRKPGIGKVGGDPRPHGPRPQNRNTA